MEWVLVWLIFSVVAGVIASAKGRSGFGYFVLSVFFSPLLGIVLAAALPSLKNRPAEIVVAPALPSTPEVDQTTHRRCPECAEYILREARKCKHCGSAVEPESLPAIEELISGNVLSTDVVGVTHSNADGRSRQQVIRDLCRKHERVELVRQPSDLQETAVIAVYVKRAGVLDKRREQIGYLNAELGKKLSSVMDEGGVVIARIADVLGGSPVQPALGVRLVITTQPADQKA